MWSSVVGAGGNFKRPGMLMSKNWMNRVWSWDHAFNAMALAYGNMDAAWDQYMCVFDAQAENGQLPDAMDAHGTVWGFVKPPIHGWALRRMMKSGTVSDALVGIPFVVLSFGEATLGWGCHSVDAIARRDSEITSLHTSRIAATGGFAGIGMKHQRAYHLYPDTPLYIFVRHILDQGWIIFQPSLSDADRTAHSLVCRQLMAAEGAEECWFGEEPDIRHLTDVIHVTGH